MPSAVLDILLLALFLGRLVRGLRAGFIVTVFDVAGLLAGLLTALWVGPRLLALVPQWGELPQLRAIALLGIVAVAAWIGDASFGVLGRQLRAANTLAGLRVLDRLAGGVASVVIVALAVWFVGTAVKPIVPPVVVQAIDGSRILTRVDAVVPPEVGRIAGQATRVLDEAGFPRVFTGLGSEPSLPATSPDAGVVEAAGVRRAAFSVVKVTAVATQCGRMQEGSGWVVAPERIVTNAHVVAGGESVTVQVRGVGVRSSATVVTFDPALDLAVLAVPGLPAAPLARAGAQPPGTTLVAAGFPLDGPYEATPMTVRGTLNAEGDDIYGRSGVTREIYALYGDVQPGNSGGPLLTVEGRVAGTVFAKSVADPTTGYALTDAASDAVLDAAASDSTPASTGACTAG
nr:MarP family serine protease [Propionibacterium sp.]